MTEAPAPMFTAEDAVRIRTIPAADVAAIFDRLAKAHLLTRRQKAVLSLFDDGWVAEPMRSPGGKTLKRYVLRGPLSHETDGPVLTAATVAALLEYGLAVRVHFPSMDKTWVFSRARYEQTPMAQTPMGRRSLSAVPTTTSETTTASSPPPAPEQGPSGAPPV